MHLPLESSLRAEIGRFNWIVRFSVGFSLTDDGTSLTTVFTVDEIDGTRISVSI